MPGMRVASTDGAGWTVEELDMRLGALRDGAARYGVGGHRALEHGLLARGRTRACHQSAGPGSRRIVKSNVCLLMVSGQDGTQGSYPPTRSRRPSLGGGVQRGPG